jgi:hypothetical protein
MDSMKDFDFADVNSPGAGPANFPKARISVLGSRDLIRLQSSTNLLLMSKHTVLFSRVKSVPCLLASRSKDLMELEFTLTSSSVSIQVTDSIIF